MAKQKKGVSPEKGSGDRRVLEKVLADFTRQIQAKADEFESIEALQEYVNSLTAGGFLPEDNPSDQPLDRAQELMYQAWDARTRNRRVKLARQALEISPDCADAYVLLAEETAKTPEEARALYEQALQAGERALGPDQFQELEGDFWGVLETRPYMRARAGLADALAALEEHQAAIDHYQAMLRLNPNDNQGVRYKLVCLLLQLGDLSGAEKLLKQFAEDLSAWWVYSRALLEFAKKGKSRRSTRLLKNALSYNPFVALYLFGLTPIPKQLPDYYGFGDENEALFYVIDALFAWEAIPGAADWFADVYAAGPD